MVDYEPINEPVYFYRFMRCGVMLKNIEVLKGTVVVGRRRTVYFEDEDYNKWACSRKEGEVYYGNLWLKEFDLDKAKETLIKHQKKKIKSLKKQIANIEDTIEVLS